MANPKQSAELADEALGDATGGFYSTAGSGTELTKKRKDNGMVSFGAETSTIRDDPQADGLLLFGNDAST